MVRSRRHQLEGIQAPPGEAHAGLWLDKFMPFQLRKKEQPPEGRKEPRAELTAHVAGIQQPKAYKDFFERQWKPALASVGAVCQEASVQGRLVIGLGGEAVLETAITLHHTYGIPYIPGSALKGLAASFAHRKLADERWQIGGNAHRIMFGNTDEAGYVTFFDALYVPGSGYQGKALWPDVITVHHPKYYQGNEAPADWDSPTPVPFLSATGRYLIALQGDEAWVTQAFEILRLALAEEGIGAKTSSGYGRMLLETVETDASSSDVPAKEVGIRLSSADQAALESFKLRLDQMPQAKVAGEIHAVYQQWRTLDVGPAVKRQIAQALLDKIEVAGRTKKSADQGWYQDLLATAVQTE